MNYKYQDIWLWFDLDDTLWDFKHNSLVALHRLYDDEKDIRQYFSSADEWIDAYCTCNSGLWKLYNRASITKDFLKLERFREPLANAGCPAPLDKLISRYLDGKYLSILGSMKELTPGAMPLLQYLKSKGYNIGIISNGFHEVQHAKIRSAGIGQYIDLMILSDDVGVNKPDIRIYEYAMNRANADSSQCIMIGDNADTDINGALNAGWQAIYYDPESMPGKCPETGVYTVTALKQIQNLL